MGRRVVYLTVGMLAASAVVVPTAASPSAPGGRIILTSGTSSRVPEALPKARHQGPAPTFGFAATIAGLTVTIALKGAVKQDGSPADISLIDSFDWGDGSAGSSITLPGGTSGSVTHTYARAGTYTISGTSTIEGNGVWAGCLCKTISGSQTVTVPPAAPPPVNQVPVLQGTWNVTGTVAANSDTTGFLGPSYNIGATVQRAWRFAQACTPTTCVTDLIRPSDVGETTTRITYLGGNRFAWQETLTPQGVCGTTQLQAGTVRVTWSMTVTTVPIPTGRPVATSLSARADFVFAVNQSGYAALGCTAPSQITYAITYTGSSPNPPPTGNQVYGGPAPGYDPGTIKVPGSSSFQAIAPGQNIPPGTTVDVSNGRGITLADPKGQTSVFYGQKDAVPSLFVYAGIVQGFVELRLAGGNFPACKKRSLQSASAEKPVRRLWGKGKGKFRTKGRYASAAVRGTWWLTADYCPRTLVQVREGVMTVRDLVKKKTVIVRAPKSYSAPAKRSR